MAFASLRPAKKLRRLGRGARPLVPLAPPAPSYGPGLWPQPVFAAGTGLLLLRSSVIPGTGWQGNGSGTVARATANLSAGTLKPSTPYRVDITIVGSEGSNSLSVGGVSTGTIESGSYTVTTGASPSQQIILNDGNNGGGQAVTALQVREIIS